jgi:hypothetical protein
MVPYLSKMCSARVTVIANFCVPGARCWRFSHGMGAAHSRYKRAKERNGVMFAVRDALIPCECHRIRCHSNYYDANLT